MPVNLTVSIPDPPAAPPLYTLCAFEVRSLTVGGELEPVAIYPGTTDGFEEAANTLVAAIASAVKGVGVGLRLAAIAWFTEAPLEECEDGQERLVSVCQLASVYEGGCGGWAPWKAETRLKGRRAQSLSHHRVPEGQKHGVSRIRA